MLFPEIDLPAALQRLAEAEARFVAYLESDERQQMLMLLKQEEMSEEINTLRTEMRTEIGGLRSEMRTEISNLRSNQNVMQGDIKGLKTDVAELKTDMVEVKSDVAELKTDMVEVKSDVRRLNRKVDKMGTDVGTLKGKVFELDYQLKAAAIFGPFLRRGRNMSQDIADALEEAEDNGVVTNQEFIAVMAADLLWGGKIRRQQRQVVLVLEASWLAELHDVERAVARADIVRRIGFDAIPVISGVEWRDDAQQVATENQAVIAWNGRIDATSWKNAVAL